MKKFLTFSIGLSLLIGIICGNIFSKTNYYATHARTGKNIKISEKNYYYEIENDGFGYYFKETKFNLSISAQSSIAVFSLSLIGYSLLVKKKPQ